MSYGFFEQRIEGIFGYLSASIDTLLMGCSKNPVETKIMKIHRPFEKFKIIKGSHFKSEQNENLSIFSKILMRQVETTEGTKSIFSDFIRLELKPL